MTWSEPDSDGGTPIITYVIQIQDESKEFFYTVQACSGLDLFCEVSMKQLSKSPWNLSHGERIVVQVIAQNKYGNSPPSQWSPLSQKMITTPEAPEISFKDKTYDSVTLNWKPVERADEYFILIDGLRSAVTQETSYTLTNQQKYSTFKYSVIASNACANSPSSEVLTVSFSSTPGPLIPVTSEQGTGKDRCNLFV